MAGVGECDASIIQHLSCLPFSILPILPHFFFPLQAGMRTLEGTNKSQYIYGTFVKV